MRPSKIAFALLVVLSLAAGLFGGAPTPVQAAGDTWYVDAENGNALFDCKTPATPCKTIKGAIAKASGGDAISVAQGIYRENVTVDKTLVIAGAGEDRTIVQPGKSDPAPCTNSALCGGDASNVFRVEADNVVIRDLMIDGDNNTLDSGVVVGGQDIDARNGIITNDAVGNYYGLQVVRVTVRDVYYRGISASSYGTFEISGVTVTNVRGQEESAGIYFNGLGRVSSSTVEDASNGIISHVSEGSDIVNNTVRKSFRAIFIDQPGVFSGDPDLVEGNFVEKCDEYAYGIYVYRPYIAPLVNNNTIYNCAVALSAWGVGSSSAVTTFSNNTATQSLTDYGSFGAYVTTNLISSGYSSITVNFVDNVFSGFEVGVYLDANQDPSNPGGYIARTITATFTHNRIHGNWDGAWHSTNGTFFADFEENWWGDASGPSGMGSGMGNSVGPGIDYEPWCLDPECTMFGEPYDTVTTIVSDTPDPSDPGVAVPIVVTVTSGVTPTGTVDITGADVNCTATLNAFGIGQCDVVFYSYGNYILTASYNGNALFNPSSDTEAHFVGTPTDFRARSTAMYDGWVREQCESCGTGGAFNSTEATFRLGDDASNRQFMGVLSFNTAALPDDALITSAVLKIRMPSTNGVIGTNPFSTHGDLTADLRKGFLNDNKYLEAADFQALASAYGIGAFVPTADPYWYSLTIPEGVLELINLGGLTQFRLRFLQDDNNDFGNDYALFFSGNASDTKKRPILEIMYILP